MKVHTKTERFNVSPEKLFAFLSNIENLPKWATAYVKELKKVGSDYKVVTPMGEMYQMFDCDAKTGVIDMYGGLTKEEVWRWPARVATDNMGGSTFAFTCIQMPDQPDEAFEGQCHALDEEFKNIRRLVEAA